MAGTSFPDCSAIGHRWLQPFTLFVSTVPLAGGSYISFLANPASYGLIIICYFSNVKSFIFYIGKIFKAISLLIYNIAKYKERSGDYGE